jgi:Kef-type K+ transport system membrane component KefB
MLARILTDRGLTRTELGVIALGCAAIDDVTAWCLLAFIVGIARAQVGAGLLVTAGHSATSSIQADFRLRQQYHFW